MNLQEKPFYLSDEDVAWVESTLSGLTDGQKLGQLFCVMGQDYDDEKIMTMVRDFAIGGILYRPEPTDRILERFRPLDAVAPVPLLKAANLEEGGSGGVSDGTFFGWPMTVSATGDVTMAEKLGAVCASEGAGAHINWTFSPVADIDMNFRNPIVNVRSFGSDAETVAAYACAYMKACQQGGVAACAKHFPGDGVDFRDQHLHPTYNSLSAEAWYQTYGQVYQALIDEGIMSIMAGHIVQADVTMEINPALTFEECLPGSLCPELLQGVLRKRFGFGGVIATDATIMGGFTQAMPRRDALATAIMAGCDMLVFNTSFDEDYGYLRESLTDGRLTRERLNEAVMRILALKACYARKKRESRSIEVAAWREECADASITLVKNRHPELFPIMPEDFPEIRLIPLGNDQTCDGSLVEIAQSILDDNGFSVEVFDESESEMGGTATLNPRRLTVYIANLETASNQTTVRVSWCEKHALNAPRHPFEEPSIFISFANPYHLQDVPRVGVYINAYSCNRDTITSALKKIMGKGRFRGNSPVDAFCALPDTRL